MAYMVNVGFLLLLLFSFAPAAAEEVKFFDEVKIERFDGDQPWYRLTIKKDGSAEFERFDSPYLGNASFGLTPQQLGKISKAIESADFFSISESSINAFHIPVVNIAVVDNGRKHAVTHHAVINYQQSENNLSPELRRVNNLAFQIERIAGVGDLVNARPWYWPLMELAYWSIVGLPICALVLLALWFKRNSRSKKSKIVALSAAVILSFLLLAFSAVYTLARVSRHGIPSHCYELSEDGWKHCGG